MTFKQSICNVRKRIHGRRGGLKQRTSNPGVVAKRKARQGYREKYTEHQNHEKWLIKVKEATYMDTIKINIKWPFCEIFKRHMLLRGDQRSMAENEASNLESKIKDMFWFETIPGHTWEIFQTPCIVVSRSMLRGPHYWESNPEF